MLMKQFQYLNSPFQFFTMILFMSLYFLSIIPSSTSLNFSYPSFLPNNTANLKFYNISPPTATDPVIQLTRETTSQDVNASCGRVHYGQQLQLWEKATSKLADFTTHFSFIINSHNKSSYADGFAFFLSSNDSLLDDLKSGGSLCLTPADPLNSTAYPFAAVEFDIYANAEWDPDREHVGVDVDSIKSAATEIWEGAQANIMEGNRNEARITYDSSSLNLSVVFTGSRNNTTIQQHLNYTVDLRSYLPERVTFGFSAATGLSFASFEILSWDFNSTLKIKKNAEEPAAGSTTNVNLAVGLSVGGFALIVAMGLISFVLWKRWKKKNEEEDQGSDEYMVDDFQSEAGPKKYSYAELASAANNFKDEQKLGEGGFGGVYKGFLRDTNSYVAIKRVSEDSRQGIREFASEVRIISRLRHRNLVQLIGWCHERKQLLLVYEYMPNGSLDFHLFKNQTLLTWEMRYKIAQGLASALLYLHEECEKCIVHRDIKPSNIMLDLNFNTKLGDFGLARLVDHTKGSRTTYLAGTLGYIAPESITTWRASKETDIYSFGIVALEIGCGRKPISYYASEKEMSMVEWVWELYGSGRILEAADPRLGGDFEPQQMECLMIVGLWCAHPDHFRRPSIRQAIQVLNFEAPLPDLPSSLPILTYVERPMRSSASQQDQDANTGSSFPSNMSFSDISSFSVTSPSVSILYSR